MSSNLEYLTDRLRTKDKKVLITTLAALRSKVNGKSSRYNIDTASFKLIVSFLKMPNQKLLNYTISVLGNCCLNDRYRKDFSETTGPMDLMLILENVAQDDIACRAWRLVGNLASSAELCGTLMNFGLADRMAAYIGQIDTFSAGTRFMVYRAIGKCWVHKFNRTRIASDDFTSKLKTCLDSDDHETVQMTLELFAMMLANSNALTVDRPLIVQMVELSKRKELYTLSIKCLAAIVSNHVFSHLIEGSGIAEVFITHLEQETKVERGILEAFCKLCREGGVRNKVKNANLFPVLIKLFHGPNVPLLLVLFLLFQFDQPSVLTLANSQDLLSVLVENVASAHAVSLLTVIARVEQPVPALVSNHNLDIFTSSAQCNQLLATIAKCKKYFKTILLSGRVWALHRAGCSMEEIGSTGYAEGMVEHCLITGDDRRKRIVALAVPFLVKPRNFKLLYKLLARHDAMAHILQALRDTPTDESVVASIVRLAQLFREQHRGETERRQVKPSQRLFLEQLPADADAEPPRWKWAASRAADTALVTFELDCGLCVTGPRDTLCAQSPVLDAMLNGHFAEAGQERVRLANCSRLALNALVKLVEHELSANTLDIQTHLELVSLTDRLLMPALGDALTHAVQLSGANCAQVYMWARGAGHAANVARLRGRAYWELLSSTAQLLPALSLASCREPLIDDISAFLTTCVEDLL